MSIPFYIMIPKELFITPVHYCQASNRSGTRCAHIVCPITSYCPLHAKLFRLSKPDECPICTESLNDVFRPLSCGHWVHRKCILKWKDQCPVCRAKVQLTAKERAQLPIHIDPVLDSLDSDTILNLILNDINTDTDEEALNALVTRHVLTTLSQSLGVSINELIDIIGIDGLDLS